jgi:uncharacterized membrane protein YhiD involved in acid resistance
MSEAKKEKKELNKGLVFGIAGALVVVIAIVLVIVLANGNNKVVKEKDVKKTGGEEEEVVDIKDYTEEELIAAYDFSKKDAETLVSEYYHSDNFEFSTTIKGAKYMVTVTDTLSNTKEVYEVNPASHEYTKVK